MKRRIPSSTRRLTREEAARLGVSYGAKHQVSSSVPKGKANARTARFTNREAANAKLRARALSQATNKTERRAARKLTKERYAKRRTQTYTNREGELVRVFNDLSEAEFFRLTKRWRAHIGVPHFLAVREGSSDTGGVARWTSGTQVRLHEITTMEDLEFFLEQWGVLSETIERYGLQVKPL